MTYCLIISVFGGNPNGTGNSRTSNILRAFSGKPERYFYVTSDFSHHNKSYKNDMVDSGDSVYLHVPSYKKNLSFRRIYSHIVFAVRLRRYLLSLSCKPDSVYCSMPTSTSAWIAGKYCKKNNIKFIVDVVDVWPDSLLPLTSLKKVMSFLTWPWKKITISAYRKADVIIGESRKYADAASFYNPDVPSCPFYLGVDYGKTQRLISESGLVLTKPDGEFWIAYGGSLGNSYDFETLIKSVACLNGKYKYKLLFIGDGVQRTSVETLIDRYGVNAAITGLVSYSDMLKYLSQCDIAVNIFKKGTRVVHSYKFNDYVAAGCFILNSLAGETAELVEKYKVGLNFDFSLHTLDAVLQECVLNWNVYRTWKENNRRLINEVLDSKVIYPEIYALLTGKIK